MEVGISVCDSAHVSAVVIGAGITLTLAPSGVTEVFEGRLFTNQFIGAYYRRLSSHRIRYQARFANKVQLHYYQY